MSNQITVTLTPTDVVWRYQGDVEGGDILTAKLQLLMQREYRNAEGVLYKVEQLPSIEGTPEELGFLPEFTSIKAKLVLMQAAVQEDEVEEEI
ncbi:hypothetical protein [Nostoc sp. UHCC 0870]|uniref:hypothetical protein n=1 Tax=Nostoc sp. UHCC 0870 TaxID=2914041 RepID=UPI001EE09452|nr:hypothetical protein [Nostoc sp. UHCC 0870]UKO99349.1 hypothetical protein L6494_06450 [Nostoc sp. UHCC 0870]